MELTVSICLPTILGKPDIKMFQLKVISATKGFDNFCLKSEAWLIDGIGTVFARLVPKNRLITKDILCPSIRCVVTRGRLCRGAGWSMMNGYD